MEVEISTFTKSKKCPTSPCSDQFPNNPAFFMPPHSWQLFGATLWPPTLIFPIPFFPTIHISAKMSRFKNRKGLHSDQAKERLTHFIVEHFSQRFSIIIIIIIMTIIIINIIIIIIITIASHPKNCVSPELGRIRPC